MRGWVVVHCLSFSLCLAQDATDPIVIALSKAQQEVRKAESKVKSLDDEIESQKRDKRSCDHWYSVSCHAHNAKVNVELLYHQYLGFEVFICVQPFISWSVILSYVAKQATC